MSRIGKLPVQLPAGVKATINGKEIEIQGPKGTLKATIHEKIDVKIEDNTIYFSRNGEENFDKAIHGTMRANMQNMVTGVTNGFSKGMNIVGVGYRAEQKGQDINMLLGFSHPVYIKPPQGITLKVETPNRLVVSGVDKQQVGQVAAEIQKYRLPEPYKGKGIILDGQVVRRKQGKKSGK
jgi:large subunit ribosomal protein L6